MRSPLVATVLAVVSCVSSAIVPEGPVRFDRTLGQVQCQTEIGFNDAPCVTSGAASHTNYVDSGRVVFRRDGTADWMLSTHQYACPCYLGGCSTPCSHNPPTVSVQTGTYVVASDSIVLTFETGGPALRTLRSSAPIASNGPASLVCVGCSSFYPVVFTSP